MINLRLAARAVIAATVWVAGSATAANLLWNGDFRTDVSGWALDDPENTIVSFSPIDATGTAGSGSMRIVNVHARSGQGTGVTQCIGPAIAGKTYTYSAKVLFQGGQARTGSAEIGLRWYSGPGCTGGTLSQPRAQAPGTADPWVTVNGGAVVAPAGTVSVEFVAFPSKVQAGGELVAQFDDLVFDDGLPEPLANYQGLWWAAPAGFESGWGINFAHQGNVIFATWFTYGPDGKPLWLAVVANKAVGTIYNGELFTTTGPPFNAVPFDPAAVVETTVGAASFTFISENSVRFEYTLSIPGTNFSATQTKFLTRQLFAQPVPRCVWSALPDKALATNYQDLWWRFPGGSESGWGINITHQDEKLFVTWFTYDANGKPLWIAGLLLRQSPGAYAGDLFTTTGPPLNAVPFDPAGVVETVVGTATITFTDGNAASFEYTVNGISQTKPITRQVFVGSGTACH